MPKSNLPDKKMPVSEISVIGEVSTKLLLLLIIGAINLILAGGSMWFSMQHPENSKDIWVVTAPIMSGSLLGCIGYVLGQGKQKG